MTREELDFIGSMNMCDEISNEAYKKIVCHCEEQEPYPDAISRQAVLDKKELIELEDGQSFYCISPEDVETLPSVNPQPKTGHWIISPNDCFATCSECGLSGDKGIFKHYRWCPICGTKMSEIPTGSDDELYFDCIDAFKEYALGRKEQ